MISRFGFVALSAQGLIESQIGAKARIIVRGVIVGSEACTAYGVGEVDRLAERYLE